VYVINFGIVLLVCRGNVSGSRCRFAYGPDDATATHCLLLHMNQKMHVACNFHCLVEIEGPFKVTSSHYTAEVVVFQKSCKITTTTTTTVLRLCGICPGKPG